MHKLTMYFGILLPDENIFQEKNIHQPEMFKKKSSHICNTEQNISHKALYQWLFCGLPVLQTENT